MVPGRHARLPARPPARGGLAARGSTTTAPCSTAWSTSTCEGRHNHEKTPLDAPEPRNLAPDLPPRLKQKLRWQWNRLRCMTPAEIGHRVARLVQARAERSGLIGVREVPRAYVDFVPHPWIHCSPGIDAAPYVAAADRIAEGWLDVFALRDVDLGSPPRWNRDPKTGIEAPLAFGKLLDYRDARPGGRHQVPVGAQPPPAPGHARAGLCADAAKRSTSKCCASTSTAGSSPAPTAWARTGRARSRRRLRLANWSARLAAHRRRWIALFEGETAAAFCAALARLGLPARGVRARLLLAAFLGQQPPDRRGGGAVPRGALPGRTGSARAPGSRRAQGDPRARGAAAERARRRQPRAGGLVPAVGARPAAAVPARRRRRTASGSRPTTSRASRRCSSSSPRSWTRAATCRCSATPTTAWWRASRPARASAATARCSPSARSSSTAATSRPRSGALDDKTRWLLRRRSRRDLRRARRGDARLPLRRAFPDGGYYVLGCEFETPERDPHRRRRRAARLPLDRRARARRRALLHALAGRREFLVDPGTYAYHTQERLARSTSAAPRAHNTVRIDGLDQSRAGRQLHVAAQGARRLQPVALLGAQGQLRGLARRLPAPARTR